MVITITIIIIIIIIIATIIKGSYFILFSNLLLNLSITSIYLSLLEKCPNAQFILVRIFLYSHWIQGNTDKK